MSNKSDEWFSTTKDESENNGNFCPVSLKSEFRVGSFVEAFEIITAIFFFRILRHLTICDDSTLPLDHFIFKYDKNGISTNKHTKHFFITIVDSIRSVVLSCTACAAKSRRWVWSNYWTLFMSRSVLVILAPY